MSPCPASWPARWVTRRSQRCRAGDQALCMRLGSIRSFSVRGCHWTSESSYSHRQCPQRGLALGRSSTGDRPDSPNNLCFDGRMSQPCPHSSRCRPSRLTKSSKILNAPQSGLTVRDGDVHVVLTTLLVDGEPLECEVPPRPEVWLDWPRLEQGRDHAEIGDAILHDLELDGDDSCHLNGTAE